MKTLKENIRADLDALNENSNEEIEQIIDTLESLNRTISSIKTFSASEVGSYYYVKETIASAIPFINKLITDIKRASEAEYGDDWQEDDDYLG